MITGFSHVQLVVRDVEVSASWWALVLGLERFAEGPLTGGGRYVALRHPQARLVVGLQTAPGVDAVLGAPSIDHLAFAVADRDTLETHCASLRAAGLDVGPLFDEAVSHNVRLRDPDGLVVELSAPRAR